MLLYYIRQTSVEYFSVLMKLIASRAAALLSLLRLLENKVFFAKDFGINNPGRQVPIFSYFFLFFSAYSYFLAISSYFSYFLAILLTISKYLLEI